MSRSASRASRPTFDRLPAGWAANDELWLCLRGATPPRLVRVALPGQKILQTLEIDLPQQGAYEITDARVARGGSVIAVQYLVQQGQFALMRGIPADR